MGLLDGLLGGALGQELGSLLGGPANQGQNNLLATALSVINSPAVGGLSGLLAHLQNGGLGHAVTSWVSTGPNVAVSGQQVQDALPPDLLSSLAAQLGAQPTDLAHSLSQMLPSLVDKLSPQGQMPAEQHVQGALGGLAKALGLG